MTNDEVLALLGDASLKPSSIAEEVECAGRPKPTTAQIDSARDALAKLKVEAVAQTAGLAGPDAQALAAQICALPEWMALALVHAAGRASRQEVLLPVAACSQKVLAKEAKRELQRLKQRGVQVQEVRPQGETVLKPPPEAEAPLCYASSIDSYGERAIWWSRAARQGVEVVQVVVSDVKGILTADALALSRKSWREFVKRLPRQGVVFTAEISKEHARALIAEAEATGARNGFSPPAGYGEALRLLGPAPDRLPPSPGSVIEVIDEAAQAQTGAALFDDPLFASWIPEEDALRSFALRVDEIAVSQLYIDARQKQDAFERAGEEASQAYFNSTRRGLYSKRLLEMAHVLTQAGRSETARTAVAVSRALSTEAQTSFCRGLFTHALRERLEQPAAPEPPPQQLIVP
ncbi:MAG TPA: hypothetical protein VGH20_05555 [Myxococcales bacterium]